MLQDKEFSALPFIGSVTSTYRSVTYGFPYLSGLYLQHHLIRFLLDL
ncbi:hypothetical protein Lepto7375DRAFT_1864 [Leptolyngbya sp. PCC 7375]|nr:hypothetical protein Lepto7375DRAFT_1864 [Leptolyngbya sp. PCC 7375]